MAVTWPADLAAELCEYGFDAGSNGLGLFAVRDAGPYRTRIVCASTGWRVINLFLPASEIANYERAESLTAAVESAVAIALSVDTLNALADLLTAQVTAELGRAA